MSFRWLKVVATEFQIMRGYDAMHPSAQSLSLAPNPARLEKSYIPHTHSLGFSKFQLSKKLALFDELEDYATTFNSPSKKIGTFDDAFSITNAAPFEGSTPSKTSTPAKPSSGNQMIVSTKSSELASENDTMPFEATPRRSSGRKRSTLSLTGKSPKPRGRPKKIPVSWAVPVRFVLWQMNSTPVFFGIPGSMVSSFEDIIDKIIEGFPPHHVHSLMYWRARRHSSLTGFW